MSATSLFIIGVLFVVIVFASITTIKSKRTRKRRLLKRLSDSQKFPYPDQDLSNYSYFNSGFNLSKISSGLNPVITNLLQPIWNKIISQHLDENVVYGIDVTHLPERLDDALVSLFKQCELLYGSDKVDNSIIEGVVFNNAIFAITYELLFTGRKLELRLRKNNCIFNIYADENTTLPTRAFNFNFDSSDGYLYFDQETYKPSVGGCFISKLLIYYIDNNKNKCFYKEINTNNKENRDDAKSESFVKKIYEYAYFLTEGL